MPTVDDALQYIVTFLRDRRPASNYGYEVYIPNITPHYAREVDGLTGGSNPWEIQQRTQALFPIFCEAAWELSRRGILRPGIKDEHGQETPQGAGGGGYNTTTAGRAWLAETHIVFVPVEPTRFAQLMGAFRTQLGDGFYQRAQEAAKCHFATAYLSCCVMCGAAAESILLAVATQKNGDEAVVLKMYNGARGRSRVESYIVGASVAPIRNQFLELADLLKYWRDNAAHGRLSTISEFEAHEALTRLLRLAQFTSDNWTHLTTP